MWVRKPRVFAGEWGSGGVVSGFVMGSRGWAEAEASATAEGAGSASDGGRVGGYERVGGMAGTEGTEGAEGAAGTEGAEGTAEAEGAEGTTGAEGFRTGYDYARSAEEKLAWIRRTYGFREDHQVILNQVHGADVLHGSYGGRFEGFDAAVTSTRNLMLTIRVADCAAVLIWDARNGVIGALHAGWRGAVEGILPKTMDAMRELGAKARDMRVYVSPAISCERFEVGEEVACRFPERFVDRSIGERPHVDLKAFLQWECEVAGVPGEQVEVDDCCSMTDTRCESYRRDGVDAGRMIAFLALRGDGGGS